MKSCIVLFTTVPEYWDDEKTRPLHSYMGSFCHKNPVYYIESYKNGNIKVTYVQWQVIKKSNIDGIVETI